jgi:hypothetical protein
MTIGEIILFVVICLATIIDIVLKHYFSKKAENLAIKQDARVITYETEKGKNLATKEDIQEITKLVESIKSEVSFENQRKHNFIEKRTELFLSVLHHAENIQTCSFLLNIYIQHFNTEEKLLSLVREVSDHIEAIVHDARLICVSFPDIDAIKELNELRECTFAYGREICTYASNAAAAIENIKLAYQRKEDALLDTILENANKQSNDLLLKYRANLAFEYGDDYVNKITNYVVLLKKLYNIDFHVNYLK